MLILRFTSATSSRHIFRSLVSSTVSGLMPSIASSIWTRARVVSRFRVRDVSIFCLRLKRWWRKSFNLVMSWSDADPKLRWECHHSAMSLWSPSLRSHDWSILKYVGWREPTCVDHEMGVWSDNGCGRDVTSASGKRSISSMEHKCFWEVPCP